MTCFIDEYPQMIMLRTCMQNYIRMNGNEYQLAPANFDPQTSCSTSHYVSLMHKYVLNQRSCPQTSMSSMKPSPDRPTCQCSVRSRMGKALPPLLSVLLSPRCNVTSDKVPCIIPCTGEVIAYGVREIARAECLRDGCE